MNSGRPDIDAALRELRGGRLVAFPTETVYGLGADAANAAAVARIFAAKGRPADHPLIVHLASMQQVGDWAREFPPPAQRLAAAFWPGPLTLVLPRAPSASDAVTGGQDTVALRVPSHPVARELLEAFGGGIAAPSANKYGRVSPTRAQHVLDEFGPGVALVLDGGDCEVGLESTIVGCDGDRLTLLRPGRIGLRQLEAAAGEKLWLPGDDAPRVPGSTRSHYAPATPVELCDPAELDRRCRAAGARTLAVLARRPAPMSCEALCWRQAPADAAGYGHQLYASLRELDALGASRIAIERVPATEEWDAIRDRLGRASRREPTEET